MTLTERDRKIVLFLVPVALIAAYWFLLLAPKRQEESKVKDQLSQVQTQRDTARQAASQLGGAKRDFSADYATVISLGKSIPSNVDMPSLLVQLDSASRGTGIHFIDVKTGARSPNGASPAPAATAAPNGGSGPTAAGAAPAQSGAGKAAQTATGAVNQANGSSSTAAAAGASGASSPAGGTTPAGLDNVPLDFEFKGSFMRLADFFHQMKRFVQVANSRIIVHGRLIVINSFSFSTTDTFPAIDAKVSATVYLAPKAEGVAAGATPQGPAGTAPSSQQASTAAPVPTATVTAP